MRSILESHSVSVLKKEISKTNIKGYSKMKKAEIVNLMLKHKERFSHIKHAKGEAPKPKKDSPKPKKDEPKPKKAEPKPKPKAPSNEQYDINYWYSKENMFMNDVMDMRSHKNNRKIGHKRVSNKLDSYLIKQKKAGKSVSGKDVRAYLNSAFPDGEYYLDE